MSEGGRILFALLVLIVSACTSGDTDATNSSISPSRPTTPRPQISATDVDDAAEDESPGVNFVETFDDNRGLERFDHGIYHRDGVMIAQTSWSGDHDAACGPPETQRDVRRDVVDESFYLCRDHLMTSIGDTSGYSTGWFSPKQTFLGATEVSWDVNVTDLGVRQWWEVAIVPASFRSGVDACPVCSAVDWLSPVSGLPPYPDDAIVIGNGPFGGDFHVHADGTSFNPSEWQKVCGEDGALGGDGCDSKKDRLPFSLRDNPDGTVTLEGFGETYTFDGSFSDLEFTLVFKDHNYTPDKDGVPVGHTWHWDNIVVR